MSAKRKFADVVCMVHTCESYRERRKTCEPFTALTVVITEKSVGNGESGGNAHTD